MFYAKRAAILFLVFCWEIFSNLNNSMILYRPTGRACSLLFCGISPPSLTSGKATAISAAHREGWEIVMLLRVCSCGNSALQTECHTAE